MKQAPILICMLGIGAAIFAQTEGLAQTAAGQPAFEVVSVKRTNPDAGDLADVLTTHVTGPVTDETGISGDYDLTLEFMPDERWRGFPSLHAANNQADNVPDLVHAIQDQLGLKFEQRKGTISVLVIDRVDKTPVEN